MPVKHGMSESSEYDTWSRMKSRCTSTQNERYGYYGGRGIKVCDRWLESFENFFEDLGKRPEGMTLDRIDNNGNYEPGNVRWATIRQQNNNTRANVVITYEGVSKTIGEWADYLGIKYNALWLRLYRRGWSVDRAFNENLRHWKRNNLNKSQEK